MQSTLDLLESLKNLKIDLLEEKDREKLRYLSLQYQFYLSQFEEQQSKFKTPVKPIEGEIEKKIESEALKSAEKFKDNEKHLSEDRLKRESKMEIPISTTPAELKRNVSQNQFANRREGEMLIQSEAAIKSPSKSFFNSDVKKVSESLRESFQAKHTDNLKSFIETLSKPKQQTMVIKANKLGSMH